MPTAFVTGGSGFVGGALIEGLAADGCTVWALARSAGAAARVEARAARCAGMADRRGADGRARGVDVVFHAAAKVGTSGPRGGRFRHVNVDGTRAMLDARRRAGVRRFVHVGTEAASLRGQALVHVDETVPLAFDSSAPYQPDQGARGVGRLAGTARGSRRWSSARASCGDAATRRCCRASQTLPEGPARLDRRRLPAHVDDAHRQRGARAAPGRRARAPRRRVVRDGRHARGVPGVRLGAAAHPGRRAAGARSARPARTRRRRAGGGGVPRVAAAGGAADDALRALDRHAGVHAERPPRARATSSATGPSPRGPAVSPSCATHDHRR